jgi:four helix bundle protein
LARGSDPSPFKRSPMFELWRGIVPRSRGPHQLAGQTLALTDDAWHPRSHSLFDQMRRAAVSAEANIVEGYGLGSRAQFKRHLRYALASAAEAETLARLAGEREYLAPEAVGTIERLSGPCPRHPWLRWRGLSTRATSRHGLDGPAGPPGPPPALRPPGPRVHAAPLRAPRAPPAAPAFLATHHSRSAPAAAPPA